MKLGLLTQNIFRFVPATEDRKVLLFFFSNSSFLKMIMIIIIIVIIFALSLNVLV